jgi:hemoglobin-like flavoprotein
MIMTPTSVSVPTTLDADLIQSSYSIIQSQNDEFAESFYQILFDKYPNIRPLFSGVNMKKQKGKLIESLDLVLVNVHNPKAFTSILKDLGKRHVKYGAVLTDYPLVGDALLQALEKHLGKDWNPDVKHAWILAYQTITDTMAEGAKSAMLTDSKGKTEIDRSIKNNAENEQESKSNRSFGFNQLIGIVSIVMVSISGYAIWTLLQPPSNNNYIPAGESRTN